MTRTVCILGPKQDPFLPATLEGSGRCPAREDYLELAFDTEAGRWKWCFPEPGEHDDDPAAPLAITMGRYGIQAHLLTGAELGPAVPSATALPMILAGAPVYIAQRLITGR